MTSGQELLTCSSKSSDQAIPGEKSNHLGLGLQGTLQDEEAKLSPEGRCSTGGKHGGKSEEQKEQRQRKSTYMRGPKAPERQGPGSSGMAGRRRVLITFGTGTRAQPES